jgi:serine/threonine protein kinase
MTLAPGFRLDLYEILEMIGKGGMGEVYRATDTKLPREVAIKTSQQEFSERFAREAKVIASLNQHLHALRRRTQLPGHGNDRGAHAFGANQERRAHSR